MFSENLRMTVCSVFLRANLVSRNHSDLGIGNDSIQCGTLLVAPASCRLLCGVSGVKKSRQDAGATKLRACPQSISNFVATGVRSHCKRFRLTRPIQQLLNLLLNPLSEFDRVSHPVKRFGRTACPMNDHAPITQDSAHHAFLNANALHFL